MRNRKSEHVITFLGEKEKSEKSKKRKYVGFRIQPIYGKGGTNLL